MWDLSAHPESFVAASACWPSESQHESGEYVWWIRIRFIADITRVVAEQLLADSVEDLTLRIDVVPQQRLPDEARIVNRLHGVFIQSSTA